MDATKIEYSVYSLPLLAHIVDIQCLRRLADCVAAAVTLIWIDFCSPFVFLMDVLYYGNAALAITPET